MVLPKLQNAISITIQQLNKAETKFNENLRENKNILRRFPSFDIDAQVVYQRLGVGGSKDKLNREGEQNYGLAGLTLESDGYVIVRYFDLGEKQIQIGDRFTRFGNITVDHYVVGFRPTAHYADQGGFTLLQVFFSNRKPNG